MNVFRHQAAAYHELLTRARVFFTGRHRHLKIRSRWHSLLVGPTGAGKSAVTAELARAIGATFARVSMPSWVPAGAHNRAVRETIQEIICHVATNSKTVLYLDEAEKIGHDTAWNSCILGEVYDILDGRFPLGARNPDNDEMSEHDVEQLSAKLRDTVFVVACGTFQDFFETQSQGQIGFGVSAPGAAGPTVDVMARRIPRELLNRMNFEILFLPQLESAHYQAVAEEAEKSVPAWLRAEFRQAVNSRMQQAVASKSGCRFVEAALVDALKATHHLEVRRDDPFDALE